MKKQRGWAITQGGCGWPGLIQGVTSKHSWAVGVPNPI
jgi:hypothetical protein